MESRPGPRVLVVDDDPTVREVVLSYLRAEHYDAVEAADGEVALALIDRHRPDLVVLDVMLPGLDGLEVARRVRADGELPIIMLTALGSEADRVVGLKLGADDYVTKPFSPRELVLRVGSVLRRAGDASSPDPRVLTDGDLVLDGPSRSVTRAGKPVPLTMREFDLLKFLMAHPRTAFTRVDLLERVWGWSFGDQSTVTVHVRRLREKVEPEPAVPTRLVTVWGVGYRWDADLGAGMSHDTVGLVLIAAGLAAAVGTVALALAYAIRRGSLRAVFALVAVSAVVALVAGFVGTARAMFLSQHDFGVVLWVSGVAGVVSLAFALLVSRHTVRAAAQLQHAARELGETGVFTAPVDTPSELTAVSRQLTDAAARLDEARERERVLDASRRELVAWVSHDLRTPLAGLRAMAEALEDGLADDPGRYHTQMRETVDRMTRLVDDLFELSRIHAGTLHLSLESVPLDEAISEALAVSAPVAQARGVRLGGHAEPGVAVRADARELSRVIGNLVTNAIRHTPSEGLVEVTGRLGERGVELSVSDACGGIPDEDLERVFDVAWRGSHARTPGADAGSGLGLAIVRGIAEAHGGMVRVYNSGTGCRFVIEIPA